MRTDVRPLQFQVHGGGGVASSGQAVLVQDDRWQCLSVRSVCTVSSHVFCWPVWARNTHGACGGTATQLPP